MSGNLVEFYKADRATVIKINDHPKNIAKAKQLGWVPVSNGDAKKYRFKVTRSRNEPKNIDNEPRD